jgi:hypothetical protein
MVKFNSTVFLIEFLDYFSIKLCKNVTKYPIVTLTEKVLILKYINGKLLSQGDFIFQR